MQVGGTQVRTGERGLDSIRLGHLDARRIEQETGLPGNWFQIPAVPLS